MAASSDIAKAGWMYRQSSVLHRWKKNWFVLSKDGDLRYFETPDSYKAEERIVVRAWVTAVKVGPDCRPADPPEGFSSGKNCYLEVVMRNNSSMLLCAESFDDTRAWQIAIDDARTMPSLRPNGPTVGHAMGPTVGHAMGPTVHHVAPPGYTTYSTTNPYGVTQYTSYPYSYNNGQTTVIHGPGGNTTTVLAPPVQQQVVYVDDHPYRRQYRGGLFLGPTLWW